MEHRVDLVPLLQAVQPYAGTKSQDLIEGILSLSRVMSSQSIDEALKSLLKVFPTVEEGGKVVAFNSARGELKFPFASFILLLMLVFLLFPDSFGEFGTNTIEATSN